MYLNMLRTSILPVIHQLCGNDPFYFKQDGASPHYHRYIRGYHEETLPGQWIERRGSTEYPPRSFVSAPSTFTCGGP
jgi:hypothetical protein